MPNETLEAVRKDYQVFTAIEQQLRDGKSRDLISLMTGQMSDVLPEDSIFKGDFGKYGEHSISAIETVLQVIQQHKADLYKKYPL